MLLNAVGDAESVTQKCLALMPLLRFHMKVLYHLSHYQHQLYSIMRHFIRLKFHPRDITSETRFYLGNFYIIWGSGVLLRSSKVEFNLIWLLWIWGFGWKDEMSQNCSHEMFFKFVSQEMCFLETVLHEYNFTYALGLSCLPLFCSLAPHPPTRSCCCEDMLRGPPPPEDDGGLPLALGGGEWGSHRDGKVCGVPGRLSIFRLL